jgi:hypothetical protein
VYGKGTGRKREGKRDREKKDDRKKKRGRKSKVGGTIRIKEKKIEKR